MKISMIAALSAYCLLACTSKKSEIDSQSNEKNGQISEGWNVYYDSMGRPKMNDYYEHHNGVLKLRERITYSPDGFIVSEWKVSYDSVEFTRYNDKDYQVGDTLLLEAKLRRPQYKYCSGLLGKIDKLSLIPDDKQRSFQLKSKGMTHEILIVMALKKRGTERLEFLIYDFDTLFSGSPQKYQLKGNISYGAHLVRVN